MRLLHWNSYQLLCIFCLIFHTSSARPSSLTELSPGDFLASIENFLESHSQSSQDGNSDLLNDIDTFVESTLLCRNITGLSLTVVQHDKVLIRKGYGLADAHGLPLTEDSPVCIGSGTKPFVAALIGILLDEHSHRYIL